MSVLSTLRQNIKYILEFATNNLIYEEKFGDVRIKRRGGLGFLKFLRRFEGEKFIEERFLSSLELKDKTIYDIGGYLGILSIFFSKKTGLGGKVIVFEPNPENCSRVQEQINLNGVANLRLISIGIGDATAQQDLYVGWSSSATASMEDGIKSQIAKDKFKVLSVDVDSLDHAKLAGNLPKPDFIKIDIEGMEYSALLGMPLTIRESSPHLYIEIHGADDEIRVKNIQNIVRLLQSWQYSIQHVETNHFVTIENCQIAKQGHIYCKRASEFSSSDIT